MTEGSEPINRLGVVDAEGNFTELAKIDYATDTDDLILAHTNSNGELRRVDADNSWKFNEPVEAPEASIYSDGSLFFGDDDQWSIKYNATAGSWVVRDETADGGVGEDVMTFNDAGSAVELARSLGTETQPVPGTSHFEAVNTAEASVDNPPTEDNDVLRWQEGAEIGHVTADGLDNSAGNNEWGQAETTVVSAVFDSAFATTPRVATEKNRETGDSAWGYTHEVTNKSATGFDIRFYQMTASDRSGSTDAYALDYIATEGR